jgi:uncharacterized protein (TIGR02466 family)
MSERSGPPPVRHTYTGGPRTTDRSFLQCDRAEGEFVLLWPTPIYVARSTPDDAWRATLINSIADHCEADTLRGNWRKSNLFELGLPGSADFVEFLRRHVRRRVHFEVGESVGLTVSWEWNGWINALPAGAWHQPHIHEHSSLSFVYYLQAEPPERTALLDQIQVGEVGGGVLQFLDPRGAAPYMATQAIDTVRASAVRLIPEAGLLILFPSFLQHFVAPVSGNGPRLSISGNIFNLKVVVR